MIMKFNSLFKKARDQKGFTLVELIVVMAILAVLAALAVPRFSAILDDSRHNAHNQNVIMLFKAGQMYLTGGGTTDIATLADLQKAGYISNSTLEVPFNTATTYGITVAVSTGTVTVKPGLVVKKDGAWDEPADEYTGETAPE